MFDCVRFCGLFGLGGETGLRGVRRFVYIAVRMGVSVCVFAQRRVFYAWGVFVFSGAAVALQKFPMMSIFQRSGRVLSESGDNGGGKTL